MFTGIVEDLGRVIRVEDSEGLRRFTLRSDVCADGVRVGDSIAVNGVCLTAVNVAANEVSVEAIPETLRLTNLGQLVAKSPVNLERPLAYGDRMGGHYVQGHVDATAELDRTATRRRIRTGAVCSPTRPDELHRLEGLRGARRRQPYRG